MEKQWNKNLRKMDECVLFAIKDSLKTLPYQTTKGQKTSVKVCKEEELANLRGLKRQLSELYCKNLEIQTH